MSKSVSLPLSAPVYSTYHYQGISTAIFKDNSGIKKWHLNNIMHLYCKRKFLNGFTTPEITVNESNFEANPYLKIIQIPLKYLRGCANRVIKAFVDDGYYVEFRGIDDYYVPEKSMYHERHFYHDGLICGYDDNEKTYDVYAYDKNWVYRVFKTPQIGFDRGRRAALACEIDGYLHALRPMKTDVELDINAIKKNLEIYLDSSFDKYPIDGQGRVFGSVVHDYINLYLDKLLDGSIPYERMDWRVFRMIWEHKKVMFERVVALEELLSLDSSISGGYESVVEEADNMRMMYASYHRRRRDSLLHSIKEKLDYVSRTETYLLTKIVS